MRDFIRHPTDMPIEFDIEDNAVTHSEFLTDISHGGLSFRSCRALERGMVIQVRIPVHEHVYEIEAVVVWCRDNPNDAERCYDVGVEFLDGKTEYIVRMVEQVAYIEHYRKEVKASEGRDLSSQEAASEWISKYAGEFPQ